MSESEKEIMEQIFRAGKKPDAAEFSKALNKLRSTGLLTNENIKTIEGWISSEFPSSIRYLARELLKGEETEEDEKEREEKIPSWDARNICSSGTQEDLSGDIMPRDLDEVVSFLLPKGGKSECLTESDLRSLLRPKAEPDRIYLFDPKIKNIIKSAPIHRLPSSGIWIIGSVPYLRMLKAYRLESFGRHIISAEQHMISGVWRQEHELFLVKPLHYEDFKSFIMNNTPLPSALTACMCLFKPKLEDWSKTFSSNYPVQDCEWLIPTWNGFPVTLGKDCGQLLYWNYETITPSVASSIEIEPEEIPRTEVSPEEAYEYRVMARFAILGFWNVINSKMTLLDNNGNVKITLNRFPINAILKVKVEDEERIYSATNANNTNRSASIMLLTEFLTEHGVIDPDIILEVSSRDRLSNPSSIADIKSESPWFFPDPLFNILSAQNQTIRFEIISPFQDPGIEDPLEIEEKAREAELQSSRESGQSWNWDWPRPNITMRDIMRSSQDLGTESAEEKTENEPEEKSVQEIPTSFRTGMDIINWMKYILDHRELQDYRSRRTITIVPDAAGTVRMRAQLDWNGQRSLTITSGILEQEYTQTNVELHDRESSLRTAEIRIAARSLEGATPGENFVVRPWHSGHITDHGMLVMRWSSSDLSEESEHEESETESETENE